MNDTTQNTDGSGRRSFIDKVFQIFQVDPKDKQELVDVFRDSEENELIDHTTRDMLEGVMEISEMRVRDIMIPRSQMETLDLEQDLSEVLETMKDTVHSRYPVVTEDKDHIEGILHAKDLLRFLHPDAEAFSLQNLLRPAVIVPESKKVDRLLKEFREERYHMAIVVDEFGGVSGVITIEDILEQIVGEIEDEFDETEEDIRQLSKHTYNVNALTTIDDFNETFKTHFSDEEIDTVGGLVMNGFSHVPDKGEEITIKGYLFKVTSADNRRIIQLQVTIPQDAFIPESVS